MNSMFTYFKRFDKWIDTHIPLLLLLVLMLLLRIPNLFEPYWYGDEGIYLTLGNGLRQGEKLYSQIIDHKTPLIYYLAMVPSQFYFRVLLLAWMTITTIAFHHLAKKILPVKRLPELATAIFVLLTTLPWFEGNIPNGELFVMGFILVGSYFLTKTTYFKSWLAKPKIESTLSGKKWYVLAGAFFGLGILTKVPALFDVVAFLAIAWFSLGDQILATIFQHRKFDINQLWKPIGQVIFISLGIILPILLSIIYFTARGSGQAYLEYGLLYNFRYAGNWVLGFSHPILLFLFSLPGKVVILALGMLLLTFGKKLFSARFRFAAAWMLLSLVASTLSNRPYPHYFLQLVPPFALLVGIVTENVMGLAKRTKVVSESIFSLSLVGLVVSVLLLLGVKPYETARYYSQFGQMMTGKITREQYRDSFNYLMADNYQAAKIIRESGEQRIFIWGTDPTLYALSNTAPTGRFTVSFHIKDFNAYQETYDDVVKHEPLFIIIMKEETQPFPELFEYLEKHYIPNQDFDNFTLWKRQNAV